MQKRIRGAQLWRSLRDITSSIGMIVNGRNGTTQHTICAADQDLIIKVRSKHE